MGMNEKQAYDIRFLKGYYPLTPLAEFAISYLESDPNSSVIKQGMMLEHIMKTVLKKNSLYTRGTDGAYPSLNEMIDIADREMLLPTDPGTRQRMDSLRKERNFAVHEFLSNSSIAEKHIGFILGFSKWFIKTWAIHREKVFYSDGGQGWAVFRYKVEYRLEGELWNFPLQLPVKEGESILDYSRRTIQKFVYKDTTIK